MFSADIHIQSQKNIPKTVNNYTVISECDNNEILSITVDAEIYFCSDTGMKGILTLKDNVIYSFQPDNQNDAVYQENEE